MFYKEFGWTPAELEAAPAQEVEDLKLVIDNLHQIQEQRQREAEMSR